MAISAKFVHVNLIARDWRKLAAFYETAFGCRPLPPERCLAGDALARGTGVGDAALEGVHLSLPGCGLTLELFQYREPAPNPMPRPDRPGFGHLGFAVDDVDAALAAVIAAGGAALGQPTTLSVEGAGALCFVYVRDPEGNILELQSPVHG